MAGNKKTTVLMKAVSQLKAEDYSREPELNNIYQRLFRARKQFAEIFEMNLKAVMQISSLDLTMQYETQKIVDISHNVAKAAETQLSKLPRKQRRFTARLTPVRTNLPPSRISPPRPLKVPTRCRKIWITCLKLSTP